MKEEEKDSESSDEGEIKPVKEKQVKIDEKYRTISTYNGGVTDNYSWS